MPLQTSGAISLNDIHVEAGGSSGTQASINDSDIRGLINKSSQAQMSFNEWYGASSFTGFTHTISSNQKELSLGTYLYGQGWNTTDDVQVTIASNVTLYSEQPYFNALMISQYSFSSGTSITIINNGKILGSGGTGGNPFNDGQQGFAAIGNDFGPITIINNSGAYICGGGGGGAGRPLAGAATGGGGAGGGIAGGTNPTFSSSSTIAGGYGGGDVSNVTYNGQAGGYSVTAGPSTFTGLASGGGANTAGSNATNTSDSGGGGGWGRAGGDSSPYVGGAAGPAISSTGSGSHSVTNNGTIYGNY